MSGTRLSSAWIIVKLLLKFAVNVAVIAAILYYVADFGAKQSLVLGLLFVGGVDVARSKPAAAATFRPHRYLFTFHMYPMLKDLGLILSDDAYRELCGPQPEPGVKLWSDKDLFHRSVPVYVLSDQPRIIHLPTKQYYTARMSFELTIPLEQETNQFLRKTFEVYVRPRVEGLEIGLLVRDWWWNERKQRIDTSFVLGEDTDFRYGSTYLALARLPYEVQYKFWGEVAKDHEKTEKELVGKAGWENSELGGDEIGYFGESYKHKYVEVWIQDLPD